MATPNIVPRASGEGGLGTSAKGWGGAFITNTTTSSATEGGKLMLACDDGAVMADNHRLGVIEFKGAEDTSSTLTNGARIQCIADAAWSASENGASLEFYTTDANASESNVLTLDSNKNVIITSGYLSLSAGEVRLTDGNLVITSATKGIIHTNTGTVIQGTSITTGVTINATSGKIAVYATGIARENNIEFTVTNSTVDTTSVILLTIQDQNTEDNVQLVASTNTLASGSFKISVANTNSGTGSTATSSIIHFLIINPS